MAGLGSAGSFGSQNRDIPVAWVDCDLTKKRKAFNAQAPDEEGMGPIGMYSRRWMEEVWWVDEDAIVTDSMYTPCSPWIPCQHNNNGHGHGISCNARPWPLTAAAAAAAATATATVPENQSGQVVSSNCPAPNPTRPHISLIAALWEGNPKLKREKVCVW
ncbi:hypothetical protein FGSG_12100 [Fusarium graminearum PH-1]|uniref:Chromosome 1, complete genome n=1 Tax=Gibberella zeae (strain ATCC MYA-4620 / CBS 123657 / FGSC 9075 / NRRL 31084 / PH-1) TaxID=229533 RepID=I1S5H9_GIBZE|nr:hypothetical protein FGSG_12100 [Fusarium graminearum PH-1]ESU07650.1 hypothetical protein FGSG_12100 [Fusarium graminearum PH-1]CEF74502.1 unnamed protein product [Fusarium graminearum]|eukprot:XP_011318135.1 hypothetical protein FGSG_12100 [Fusarium graminearum PH-1]